MKTLPITNTRRGIWFLSCVSHSTSTLEASVRWGSTDERWILRLWAFCARHDYSRGVTQNAVLVRILLDLLSQALLVEHMQLVASQSDDTSLLPVSADADSAVKEFSFLEEERAVGKLGELANEPEMMSWVATRSLQNEEREKHHNQVDWQDDEEVVQHLAENTE